MRHIFICLTAKLPLLQAKHKQVLPLLTDPTPSWASTWVYVLEHQNPSCLAVPVSDSVPSQSPEERGRAWAPSAVLWVMEVAGTPEADRCGGNPAPTRLLSITQLPLQGSDFRDIPCSRHLSPALLSFHIQSFPMFCLHVSFYSLRLSFSFFIEVEI